MTRSEPLPVGARLLVGLVLLGGAAALARHLPALAGWSSRDVLACLTLTAGIAACEVFQVEVPYRRELTAYSVVDGLWTAALFLAEPSVLLAAVCSGVLLGQGLQPSYTAKLKVVFNVAQFALGISAALAVYELLGSPPATEPRGWLAAAAAMGVFQVVNTVLVGAVIALVEHLPFWQVALVPTGMLHWVGNVALGILGALAWTVQPWAAPLLLVPLVMTFLAYQGWLRSSAERDAMRAMARTGDGISHSGDPSARLEVPAGQHAAAALALTLNRMLDRLDAGFQRERRFIREASHELRTPITIVQGHLEVLGPDPDREEISETAKLVIDELDRMARIVDDMNMLARVEDPDTLRVESFALDGFVADLAARAATLLGRPLEVDVRGGAAGAPVVVRADPQRLTQALINLVTNARDHTPPGTPIRLRVRSDAVTHRFEVADEGGGVTPEVEASVFRPFHKGRDSLGSGLGLALVAGIATAHAGRAGLDNRPGRGATFWLQVPR